MAVRTRFGRAVVALVVAAAVVGGCRGRDAADNPYAAALLALQPTASDSPAVAASVDAFYVVRDHALAWHDRRGDGIHVAAALDILRDAEAHGLRSTWYGLDDLTARVATRPSSDAVSWTAALDRDLTMAVLQLGLDVAIGRRDPSTLDPRWNTRRNLPDLAAALQSALEEGGPAFLDRVRPVHREYHALQAALATLRSQARAGWPRVPHVALREAARHDAVPVLGDRLAAAGYLEVRRAAAPPQLTADVKAALARFQEHHGLRATGVLDAPTLAEMNVPIARRIAEVELNLERWRWLPDDLGARHLVVNIPQFHLFVREDGGTVADIRVVVGRRGNETPTFSDQLREVVFSPYWNVPETIAREETIPAVARDPEYLSRQNLEVIRAGGEVVPPSEIPWDDEEALRRLSFRQRPGPGNALGFVKFLFPNEHNVYLHDTPADALFARVGRAFSHGCVRVEEPEVLAQYVLRDQPEWTMERIVLAMRGGTERHVPLSSPLPVHIVYFTAAVDAQGGLHHFGDVYGYDARSLGPSRSAGPAGAASR